MLSTILLVILSLVGVLGDVSHILEDHQRNLPSHGPYVFSYTAGYPGNVDRQHAEVRDGSGVVRGTYSYADPQHRGRTVGGWTGDTPADDHHRAYANIANSHARAHANIANNHANAHANHVDAHARIADAHAYAHARASGTYSYADPHHRERTVDGGTADTRAVKLAKEQHHRLYAKIANDHAHPSGQFPPRQTAAVRAATNSHARLFNVIAEQHARIADDRGQLQRDDGLQYEDRYY